MTLGRTGRSSSSTIRERNTISLRELWKSSSDGRGANRLDGDSHARGAPRIPDDKIRADSDDDRRPREDWNPNGSAGSPAGRRRSGRRGGKALAHVGETDHRIVVDCRRPRVREVDRRRFVRSDYRRADGGRHTVGSRIRTPREERLSGTRGREHAVRAAALARGKPEMAGSYVELQSRGGVARHEGHVLQREVELQGCRGERDGLVHGWPEEEERVQRQVRRDSVPGGDPEVRELVQERVSGKERPLR